MNKSPENPLRRSKGRQRNLWNDSFLGFQTEQELVAAALALGAEEVKPWSPEEVLLARRATQLPVPGATKLDILREQIMQGQDPLGDAFCLLRSPEERRNQGATYTPAPIIRSMIDWASTRIAPERIIDPGTGSGRFLMQAANTFPTSHLIGIDTDPLSALLGRANLTVKGAAKRSRIVVGDYREFIEPSKTPTLFIGNPPYVRHHGITEKWKLWLASESAKLGLKASKLAGLHIHFFLATARIARRGDIGAFITAAEWLDVNYGALVRSLLLKELGGYSVTIIEPTANPFPDAATTAAVTTYEIGAKPKSVLFRRVSSLANLGSLDQGRRVSRDRLHSEARWSYLGSAAKKPAEGYVELGEICRVHRGQVTGANNIWIAGKHSVGLPQSFLFRTVTRAQEVIAAEGILEDSSNLRHVIDLPTDLDELERGERVAVDSFLERARAMGASRGYIASHRKAWWSVGLRLPAPIISTYMARRPPAFALNRAYARHINIAHGLYPLLPLSDIALAHLVTYLQSNVSQRSGRTYAGGLTKFEPREMERLLVPAPETLQAGEVQ